jgi:hypothetical protein
MDKIECSVANHDKINHKTFDEIKNSDTSEDE